MAINRIRADIDLDAILYNMESMHNKLKPGTMMAAVVKADGYGHGAAAACWGCFRGTGAASVSVGLCRCYKQRGNAAYRSRQKKADTYFRTQLPGAV